MTETDILIIGAGAAGLSAARELSAAGLAVIILEARDRIGGRIHTYRNDRSPLPVELGAEFIHGRPAETLQIADRARFQLAEVPSRHWYLHDGILTRSGEFWSKLEGVLEQMQHVGPPDQSFAEFLESYGQTHELGEAKTIAGMYVEGFHAARTERISVLGLNKVNEAADCIEGDRQFRSANGYDLIMRQLYDEAVSRGARFHLNTIVEEVRWRPHRVEVISRSESVMENHRAVRLLATLPLGVLQAAANELGTVRFVPPLREKEAAARKLAMGQVIRIVLRFSRTFWEDLDLPAKDGRRENLKELSFLHAPDELIPTWWTQLPARAPLLVGWVGGPRAEKLSLEDDQFLLNAALESLAHIFGRPRQELEELLEESYAHNWRRDPFSRGAYSYIAVGGVEAPAQLAQPVAGTLFFAGEAANTEGHGGTVHGAIASGIHAAHEIMKASES